MIQIGYLSLLSFEKVPPTFVGLKYLKLSNGVNDLNINSSGSQTVQDIFKIIGLDTLGVSNYNLTLILFVFLPLIIGLVGYLIKIMGKKSKI